MNTGDYLKKAPEEWEDAEYQYARVLEMGSFGLNMLLLVNPDRENFPGWQVQWSTDSKWMECTKKEFETALNSATRALAEYTKKADAPSKPTKKGTKK